MDCSSSSDDDDDQNELVLSFQPNSKPQQATRPRQDFAWDDRAIVKCLQIAVDSHSQRERAAQNLRWKVIPSCTDEQQQEVFIPKPIPLPTWVVDPLLSSASPKSRSTEQEVETTTTTTTTTNQPHVSNETGDTKS